MAKTKTKAKAKKREYDDEKPMDVGDLVRVIGNRVNQAVPPTEEVGTVMRVEAGEGIWPLVFVQLGPDVIQFNSNQLKHAEVPETDDDEDDGSDETEDDEA
jgi:hypothetical protein